MHANKFKVGQRSCRKFVPTTPFFLSMILFFHFHFSFSFLMRLLSLAQVTSVQLDSSNALIFLHVSN